MRLLTYLLSFTVVATTACQSESKQQDKTEEKAASGYTYSTLPDSVRQRLLRACDYVDIIFYDQGLSMSQDDPNSTRASVLYASGQPVEPDPDCRPMGRISYMIQGEIIAEADFYCSDECQYLLFMDGSEVAYAENMSAAGVNHFRNILDQIQQMQQ